MKKLFMIVALAAITMTANAQKVGVWYGLGFNKITNLKVEGASFANTDLAAKMYCSPVNFGATYTQEMGKFDLIGGLSYRQKGTSWSDFSDYKWKPKFIQFDFQGAYNFYKDDEGTNKFGIFTGPYVALMTGKDSQNFLVGEMVSALGAMSTGVLEDNMNKCDVGWTIGLNGVISNFTISAGYEFGFIKMLKEDGLYNAMSASGWVGSVFKTKGTLNQGVFIKVGYQFGL